MKFQNRFMRLAVAVAIVGVVATQVPSRSAVAVAADGYPDPKNNPFNLSGAGGAILGAVVVGAGAGALGKAAGGAVGSVSNAGIGAAPIADVVSRSDDYEALAKIIKNAGQVDDYRAPGQYTLFAPTTAALTKALGESGVKALQQATGIDAAKQFLASITIEGSYNLDALRDAAKSGKVLKSLSGQAVVLKLEGDKLFANGVEILSSENPASNGWVIGTNGVISTDES